MSLKTQTMFLNKIDNGSTLWGGGRSFGQCFLMLKSAAEKSRRSTCARRPRRGLSSPRAFVLGGAVPQCVSLLAFSALGPGSVSPGALMFVVQCLCMQESVVSTRLLLLHVADPPPTS